MMENILLLHIETSGSICSVCISKGMDIVAFAQTEESYSHAQKITILIQKCLEDASIQLSQIGAVSLSQGPGSYTGLRVGTSVAKGICYALEKPLIAIDTLQAIAAATYKEVQNPDALYIPMIDARRMEVYTAVFDHQSNMTSPTEAMILDDTSFQRFLQDEKQLVISGSGAEKAQSVLHSPLITFSGVTCSAFHLVPFALAAFQQNDFADTAYFSPYYFKAPNITQPKKNIL